MHRAAATRTSDDGWTASPRQELTTVPGEGRSQTVAANECLPGVRHNMLTSLRDLSPVNGS